MKLQILADLEKLVKLDPNCETNVSMRPINAKGDENVIIRRESSGMMKAYLSDGKRAIASCPYTNDYRIIEQWLSAMNIQMSEYKPPRKPKKSIWAYIDGKRTFDVVELALAASIMVEEMKKKLKVLYPSVIFKVETA